MVQNWEKRLIHEMSVMQFRGTSIIWRNVWMVN